MSGADTPAWTVEVWEDPSGHSPFMSSYRKLGQYEQAVLDAVIEHVLTVHGIDICGWEWGKALGDGLYEVRVRRSLDEVLTWGQPAESGSSKDGSAKTSGVLLRLFVTFHGNRVVLLFNAYDKRRDPSERRQDREIKAARKHLKAWRQEQARDRATARRTR